MARSAINIGAASVAATNIGAGTGLYACISPSNNINFKTLTVAGSIAITSTGTEIQISGGSGGGSTSPAAPVNSIQFNTGSTFAGTANFLFDEVKNSMTIGTRIIGTLGENSATVGTNLCAAGVGSFVTGKNNIATTAYSHVEGCNSRTQGIGAHAEGGSNQADADYSHAEGGFNKAVGNFSHTEGASNCSQGTYSHTEGSGNFAVNNNSHAEGTNTIAFGIASHAEGRNNCAQGGCSHAQGYETHALGIASHVGGSGLNGKEIETRGCAAFNHSFNNVSQTIDHGAFADFSAILGGINHHIETGNTGAAIIGGNAIKLTGSTYVDTTAVDNFAIITQPTNNASSDEVLVRNTSTGVIDYVSKASIGGGGGTGATTAINGVSINTAGDVVLGGTLTGDTLVDLNEFGIVFGNGAATATGSHAMAIGNGTTASGNFGSFAAGYTTTASGALAASFGISSTASGQGSMAVGNKTTAAAIYSFAAGTGTTVTAGGCWGAAFGHGTTVSGDQAFAQGLYSYASGYGSHAEGYKGCSLGVYSHAEGSNTFACGAFAHSEGSYTTAHQNASHAQGLHTFANAVAAHVGGAGTATRKICAAACAAFNHSSNDGGAIEFWGAHANFSAILGGENHNIAATETRAVIIGGCAINLSGGSYVDTTAVPNLAIISGLTNNVTSDEVLVRNTSTGVIDYVSKASIGGGSGSAGCYPNTLWVSVSGDNTTALTGDNTKPFATFGCALTEANALSPTTDNRALICVASGSYPNQTVASCNYVDWYFDHNTYVCNNTSPVGFSNVNANLTGYGCFRLSDGNTGFAINMTNVTGTTEFHSVYKCATNGAALNITCGIQDVRFQYAYNGCNVNSITIGVEVTGTKINMVGNCIVTHAGQPIVLEDTGSYCTNGYVRIKEIIATGTSNGGFYNSSAGNVNICVDRLCARTTGIIAGANSGCWSFGGQIKSGIDSSGYAIQFLVVGSTASLRGGTVLENVNGTTSIFAGSAQTIKILGHAVSKCAVSGNITTSVGTFTVDSTVEVV